MKLATYRDGSRDGQLVVVSRDLRHACYATDTATRMQQVLDDWNFISPQLQDIYIQLNQGRAPHSFAFDPKRCMAPLPRPAQWLEANAFAQTGAGVAQIFQHAGDQLWGAHDAAELPASAIDMDMGAGWAAICSDVPLEATPERALESVRLLMLVNVVSLRALESLAPALSRPFTACSPVAVTLDEVGEAWQEGRLGVTLQAYVNTRRVAWCDGASMWRGLHEVIAAVSRVRTLRAGSVVGSGVLASADASLGFGSMALRRAYERQTLGEAQTPWLEWGDHVRVEAKTRDGSSLFGSIDHSYIHAGTGED